MFLSRIDRYILLQLIGVFGFFALILVVIYWINRAVGLLDSLIGDGQSVGVFLQMSLLSVPTVLELIAPMAGFGAGVFVVNRLRQDSEMVVLQALGFSFCAAGAASLGVWGGGGGNDGGGQQWADASGGNTIAGAECRYIARCYRQAVERPAVHETRGWNCAVFSSYHPDGELQDIFISDTRNPKSPVIYTAKRSYLVGGGDVPKLLMQDGLVQRNDKAQNRVTVSRFDDSIYSLDGLAPSNAMGQRGVGELSTPELLRAGVQVLQETGQAAAGLRYSGHLRISWPISAALTSIIGFVSLFLGGFDRQGLRWQMAAATLLLIGLYLVHILTMAYAPAYEFGWVLAYTTPLLGVILALLVLWQSGRKVRVARVHPLAGSKMGAV